MKTHTADVAVIGAGTAGLAAERHARGNGARTVLIDPEFAGTTCANVGCMPSKLLIAAADAADGIRQAEAFGIAGTARIDGPAVMARVRRMRDDFAGSVRDSIADLPEGTCLRARARFAAPGVLSLDNGDRVEARAVVIATGSAAAVPDAFAEVTDRVLTNATLFELEDLPGSVGVIGAGPLGLELAQALCRLGVRVEVFDAGGSLAGLPPETSGALHDILSLTMPIHLDCAPEATAEGDGVALRWDGQGARFDRLLLAAGRPPNLEGLDLEAAGLTLDSHGVPVFDPETMQCGEAPVFLAGDVDHDRPVLHEASAEGTIAGRNAARFPDVARAARMVPLAITFTRPEAATIGTIPEADDPAYLTGEVDYGAQGRAQVMDRAHGLCRIHARAEDGRLVGASLCAPDGEHLAHLLAWLIECRMTASQALNLPFYHPTLEEGLQTALRELCGKAGLERPWERDDSDLPGSRGRR